MEPPVLESLFTKAADFQHKCFPLKYATFSRESILTKMTASKYLYQKLVTFQNGFS